MGAVADSDVVQSPGEGTLKIRHPCSVCVRNEKCLLNEPPSEWLNPLADSRCILFVFKRKLVCLCVFSVKRFVNSRGKVRLLLIFKVTLTCLDPHRVHCNSNRGRVIKFLNMAMK